MLNHYDLGLYVESWLKSFVISGLPGLWELKYRKFDRFGDCFCTYVLMIWSILLQGWFGWCVLLAYKMGPVNVNGWLGWVVFLAYVMNCECEWMVWLGGF